MRTLANPGAFAPQVLVDEQGEILMELLALYESGSAGCFFCSHARPGSPWFAGWNMSDRVVLSNAPGRVTQGASLRFILEARFMDSSRLSSATQRHSHSQRVKHLVQTDHCERVELAVFEQLATGRFDL